MARVTHLNTPQNIIILIVPELQKCVSNKTLDNLVLKTEQIVWELFFWELKASKTSRKSRSLLMQNLKSLILFSPSLELRRKLWKNTQNTPSTLNHYTALPNYSLCSEQKFPKMIILIVFLLTPKKDMFCSRAFREIL